MYVCVFVAVSVQWELVGHHQWSRKCSPIGTPACDMVETAHQPAGWWILATGVKFAGFWEVNMYNILDFWKADKEMVQETNIVN